MYHKFDGDILIAKIDAYHELHSRAERIGNTLLAECFRRHMNDAVREFDLLPRAAQEAAEERSIALSDAATILDDEGAQQ